MIDFVSQIINGLAIGNVYALIALGFTLVFGVARLINFAQGSLFMVGAYLAFSGVAVGMPLIVAALAAIAGTTLLGIAIERVGVRPLERGPLIAPFLSTLAIAFLIDEVTRIVWSPDPLPFPRFAANAVWQVGHTFLTVVDLMVVMASAVAMISLMLFLSGTWQGRAIRAAAQDPDAALQMGVDVGRARRWAFGLAAALGALAGVLTGLYYTSIFPTMGFPYAVKGFAAALLGGLGSIPGAILGGLLLGVFESLTSGYLGEDLRDIFAYALLLLVLLLRPEGVLGNRRLATGGGIAGLAGATPGTSLLATPSGQPLAGNQTFRPRGWQIALSVLVAALLPFAIHSPYVLQVITFAMIFAILAIGLTVVSGAAGQISVHHAALFGVGAYSAAILAKNYGWPVELVLPAAAAITGATAVLVAVPAMRLSGHAVALASLAIGMIGYMTFLTWIDLTRGPFGITGIPNPEFAAAGGAAVASISGKYWLTLVALIVTAAMARGLLRSPIGRAWRAIREDRPAAQTTGIPVTRYLAMAHAVGGVLAGIAGALFAYLTLFVSPQSFNLDASILLLTIIILGGMGNVWGAILGALVMLGLYEVLRPFNDYRLVALSLILLLALRVRPQGLLGTH